MGETEVDQFVNALDKAVAGLQKRTLENDGRAILGYLSHLPVLETPRLWKVRSPIEIVDELKGGL